MKADEIMHALRLTAMGRVNTPEQVRLCEALAEVMERTQGVAIEAIPVVTDEEVKAKRARKKAE